MGISDYKIYCCFFPVPQKSSQSFSIYDQDDQRPHVQALLRPLTSIMERYFFSTPKNFPNFFLREKKIQFFVTKSNLLSLAFENKTTNIFSFIFLMLQKKFQWAQWQF